MTSKDKSIEDMFVESEELKKTNILARDKTLKKIAKLRKEQEKYPIGLLVENPFDNIKEHTRIQNKIDWLNAKLSIDPAIARHDESKKQIKKLRDSSRTSKSARTRAEDKIERDSLIVKIANKKPDDWSQKERAEDIQRNWGQIDSDEETKISIRQIETIISKGKVK